ncbi:TLC domain-containing protein 2-like [Diadema antillarum]|uniref:TLC domain-containing protein 2-like n=1 Tax=Diadema antillarum TaxID=105358 RepID=UPI003A895EF1
MLSSATVGAMFVGSSLAFSLLNAALRKSPPDEKFVAPAKRHKWRNEVCSLTHAVVVAFGAVHCWTMLPPGGSTQKDVSYLREAEVFGAISSGYYLYDFADLMLHNSLARVTGLCVHHVVGIGCFYTSYVMGRFYDYCVYCMLVHLAGIFLHLRILMVMHGIDKGHPIYRANALVNVVAFATFRLGIMFYVLVMVLAEPGLGAIARVITSILMGGLVLLNVVLFKRLVVSDVLPLLTGSSPASAKKKDDNILDTT